MNIQGLSWPVLPWRHSRVMEPDGSAALRGCFSSGQRPVNWVSVSTRLGMGSVDSSQFTVSGSAAPSAPDASDVLVMVCVMRIRPPCCSASVSSRRILFTASSAVMVMEVPNSSVPSDATDVLTVVQRANTGLAPRYASSPGRPAKASAPCGSNDGRSAASGFSCGGVTFRVIASSWPSNGSLCPMPKSRPQYSTCGISSTGVFSITQTSSRFSTTWLPWSNIVVPFFGLSR